MNTNKPNSKTDEELIITNELTEKLRSLELSAENARVEFVARQKLQKQR